MLIITRDLPRESLLPATFSGKRKFVVCSKWQRLLQLGESERQLEKEIDKAVYGDLWVMTSACSLGKSFTCWCFFNGASFSNRFRIAHSKIFIIFSKVFSAFSCGLSSVFLFVWVFDLFDCLLGKFLWQIKDCIYFMNYKKVEVTLSGVCLL